LILREKKGVRIGGKKNKEIQLSWPEGKERLNLMEKKGGRARTPGKKGENTKKKKRDHLCEKRNRMTIIPRKREG